MYHCVKLGFTFSICPRVFLLNRPHPKSAAFNAVFGSGRLSSLALQRKQLFAAFKREIAPSCAATRTDVAGRSWSALPVSSAISVLRFLTGADQAAATASCRRWRDFRALFANDLIAAARLARPEAAND